MSNAVYPKYKAWKANGVSPASGYYLYTYESGGTTIPKATYSDAALITPNSNPVILNSVGEANIFLSSGSYRFDLKTAAGSLVNTFDPVVSYVGGVSVASVLGVVNTVAELKALNTATYGAVIVLGYLARGDGGGGLFEYDSASVIADNAGTVFQPASLPATGRWIRVYSGALSAKWFGWTGAGGGTDSTALAAMYSVTDAVTNAGYHALPGQLRINNTAANPGGLSLNTPSGTDYARVSFDYAGNRKASIYGNNGALQIETNTSHVDIVVGAVSKLYVGEILITSSVAMTIASTLQVTSDLSVNTNKFVVTASTGRISGAENLYLTGLAPVIKAPLETTGLTIETVTSGIYFKPAGALVMTVGGGLITIGVGLTLSSLTPSRIPYLAAGGAVSTTANLAYDGTTITLGANTITAASGAMAIAGAASFNGGIASVASSVSGFYEEGSFTGTLVGCTTSPTATFKYVRIGKHVTLYFPSLTATSNTTGLSVTGLPASITPLVAQDADCARAVNNSSNTTTPAFVNVSISSTLTFFLAGSNTGWTAAGTKGFLGFTTCYTMY